MRRRAIAMMLTLAVMACGGHQHAPSEQHAAEPGDVAPQATPTSSHGVPIAPPAPTHREPPARMELHSAVLPSGLEVVVMPAATPTVTVMWSLAVGSLDDRPGVAELTAQMVAAGAGADEATSREHDMAIASIGANVESEVLPRRTRLWVTVQRAQLDEALKRMAGLVARAALRSRRFYVLRRLAMERRTARARDEGVWASQQAAERWLSSGASPDRATSATRSELSRIQLAHVKQLYQDRYQGSGSRLLIVGIADLEAAKARLASVLTERWTTQVRKPPASELPPLPAATADAVGDDAPLPIHIVDQPGSEQAVLTSALLLKHGEQRRAPALAISEELLRDGLDGVFTDDGWLPATAVRLALHAEVGTADVLLASVVLPGASALSAATGATDFFPHGLLDVAPRFERAKAAALSRARAAWAGGEPACHLYERIRGLGGTNEDVAVYLRRLAAITIDDISVALGPTRQLPRVTIAADLASLGPLPPHAQTVDGLRAFEPSKPRTVE